jgi:hypothetical protein
MADVSAPEIKEAYDDVRADASDTNWLLITVTDQTCKKWKLAGKGAGGLEELKSNLAADFIGFGYLRVISGDELSKRPKFVFIRYLGKGLKLQVKAQLNVVRGDVEKVLAQHNVVVDAETPDELTEADIADRVSKAGGAHYN